MFNEFSRHEEAFNAWVKDGYPGVKAETLDYLRHLADADDESRPREGVLWPHQWQAFLRVVYAREVEREALAEPNGVLLNIVTGGGKTAIIAAVIVWLRIAHDVNKFVILCPGRVVRDRLEEDFGDGKVFVERDLIPAGGIVKKDDFALTTLGSDRAGGWASLLGASIVLGNIQQFYTDESDGGRRQRARSNLSALLNGPRFALFNDEAHNSPAAEWDAAIEKMRPRTVLRVDTTATPNRADNKTPDSSMIFEYSIQDALAERLVKTPVVYQPNIRTVELTYTDARTGERRAVEQIDWEDVDRRGLSATQWVTDDEPMRQQMAIALQRLREQERRARGRYQPALFVVAVCQLDAEKAVRTLQGYFKVKTLLVTQNSTDEERRQAAELNKARRGGEPYKAVVSILMLREGWDLPEVGVILLLRKFSSPVYGQQVIGRGLRRVRGHRVEEAEQQICAVVDHPKLEHQWLWDIFGSKIRPDVGVDDTFNEQEDLPAPPPRQEIVAPERLIDIPDERDDGPGEFDIPVPPPAGAPLRNWREVLDGLIYPSQMVVITGQRIDAVERRELTGDRWRTRESAPPATGGDAIDPGPDALAGAIRDELLNMAGRLLDRAGHTAQFTGDIYAILLEHVRAKFLDGASLGLAEPHRLEAVWRMLPTVEKQIAETRGLVEGMVSHGR